MTVPRIRAEIFAGSPYPPAIRRCVAEDLRPNAIASRCLLVRVLVGLHHRVGDAAAGRDLDAVGLRPLAYDGIAGRPVRGGRAADAGGGLAGGRRESGGPTTGLDIGLQRLAQLRRVRVSEVDLVRLPVEGEEDGLPSLPSITSPEMSSTSCSITFFIAASFY